MIQNKHIKIAGLGLLWTVKYATQYKTMLIDMGFEVKILHHNHEIYVAYSPLNFLTEDALILLKVLLRNGENDESTDKS